MVETRMNKFEETKAIKDGLDALEDIHRLAHVGWEAITEEDKMRMKWYGLFFRRYTPGFFMLRIRIPGGIATSAQLRTIAKIASEFGRGTLDLTTRQQIQIRWLRIEDMPAVFARLSAVGLDSRQTGMDNIRNVVGCPLAGITTHEVVDATPIVWEYNARFVGNKAFSNLPRKFNVAITGCTDNCVHLETQDIALGPAHRTIDGQRRAGFNVTVGGKQGSGGFSPAQPLDVFVTAAQAAEVCAQLTLIFRDHGPRETRSRARFAFLIGQWGIERVREELQARVPFALEPAGCDARGHCHSDHLGVTAEHDRSRHSVGLAVPVGRLSSVQTAEVALLAAHYGRGEVRLTPGQNLVITHVAASGVPALLDEPLLGELTVQPSPALRGTVSCTGLGLCDLALADTKNQALDVARRLEGSVALERPLSIHWSGCPAACGNHYMADIGLQGGKARIDGSVVEVYQVYVGGRSGPEARPGVPVLDDVPRAQIGDVIERLAAAHAAGHDLVDAGQALARERGGANAEPDLMPVA
ncbi:MAG: ferredoxin-nitrite reductase [Chloroflexota bacterium]|jgi:ferredoxin-nitrite reductase|nr:ferredoxin-nitrite reductase [Chloroflexota bacterium]